MTEILFLIPYRLTRPYFASLYCECLYSISARYPRKYRFVVTCVPKETDDLNPNSVLAQLDDEREFHRQRKQEGLGRSPIGLLVVVPTESEKLTKGVAEFAADLKIPVVALSLPFQHDKPFTDNDVPIPETVHCCSVRGGKLLAAAACADLRTRLRKNENPRVLLIAGEKGRTDSDSRLASFQKGLRDEFKPDFLPVLHCNWQRNQAREAMLTQIRGQKEPIHVVMCANDEMALGARDAIKESRSTLTAHCCIYGYDAVGEVQALIDSDDHNLRGTVEQDIAGMAEALTELIGRIMEPNPSRPPKGELVTPGLYPKQREPTAKKSLAEQVATLPEFKLSSGLWVTTKQAAKYLADTLKPKKTPTEESLESYRGKKHGGETWRSPDGCVYGRDKAGRIWRKGSDGEVHYWKESLNLAVD